MNQIVASMHAAYNNRTKWHRSDPGFLSVFQLWNWGLMKPGRQATWQAHPSSLTGFVDEPTVILGTGNTIALWYLPGAITNDLQASLQTHMLATLDPLHHTMSKITRVPGVFPGQAPTGAYGMAILPQGCEWSQRSYLLAAILSGALSIMHPGLYEAGRQAMQSLDTWSSQHNQDMQDALQHWPSVFTNVSVISNLDHTLSPGPTLTVRLFLYNPGTVVAFSGQASSTWGIPRGDWMRVQNVWTWLMPAGGPCKGGSMDIICHPKPSYLPYTSPKVRLGLARNWWNTSTRAESSQTEHWEIGLLVVHETMAYVPEHMDW
ncbi:hypothetical protein BKA82DRAFT_4016992 [Pisolithus tinctorius]|nr:hypothetical protein BKA82DRAFT_4016992 [Pisolithus tinctorius]